jgi:hypothetical protein
VVVLAAVNLLSERVSFSKIIEGNRTLSALDALGRKKSDRAVTGDVSVVNPYPEVWLTTETSPVNTASPEAGLTTETSPVNTESGNRDKDDANEWVENDNREVGE